MNGYSFSLIITSIFLGLIGGLVYLASQGNIAAIATLSALVALGLVLTGIIASYIITDMTDKREHKQMTQMMKGDLSNAILLSRLVNQQNSQLWIQASKHARLPEPKGESKGGIIEIDESSFNFVDEE